MSGAASRKDTDARLVPSLMARDPAAWSETVRRYSGHVEAVLRHRVGPDSEIADMIQDVFLRALRGIDGFRGETVDLPAWLAGIAKNTARSFIRRRHARGWIETRDPHATPDPPANVPGPEVLRAMTRTRQLMEHMPEQERRPFGLRVIDGLELTEVASACNVSLATTKRRLARARGRIERLGRRDPVLAEWVEPA